MFLYLKGISYFPKNRLNMFFSIFDLRMLTLFKNVHFWKEIVESVQFVQCNFIRTQNSVVTYLEKGIILRHKLVYTLFYRR
jgi:hypothetical protein